MIGMAAGGALSSGMWGGIASGLGSMLSGGMFGGNDGGMSVTKSLKLLDAQRERQRYDATLMPSYMVEGAKNAGLHPSVVFGAGGYQPSNPVMIPAYNDSKADWGSAVGGLGQNIGRAYMANKDADERAAEINYLRERQAGIDMQNLETHNANMENMDLQNRMLAVQLHNMRVQLPPPAPPHERSGRVTIGDPITQSTYETGQYKVNPAEVTSANPHQPAVTAGPQAPAMTRYRFGGPNYGFPYELPAGSSASEALEAMGSIPAAALTFGHNALRSADNFVNGDPRSKPSDTLLPPGYHWEWKTFSQTWRASKNQKGGK